jgi:hypothetical protein
VAARTLVYASKFEAEDINCKVSRKRTRGDGPAPAVNIENMTSKQVTGSIPGRVITWRVRCFFLSLRLSPEKSNQKYSVTKYSMEKTRSRSSIPARYRSEVNRNILCPWIHFLLSSEYRQVSCEVQDGEDSWRWSALAVRNCLDKNQEPGSNPGRVMNGRYIFFFIAFIYPS